MQRLRALILLLTTLMTAVTAIGMEMLPISTPAATVHDDAAEPERHHDDGQPGESHDHGSHDCAYCQLAKATDLPAIGGTFTARRRLLPRIAGMQTASCHLQTWTLPCQPRAPPPSIAS